MASDDIDLPPEDENHRRNKRGGNMLTMLALFAAGILALIVLIYFAY